MKTDPRRTYAFTLIETTLVIGILAVAFVPLVGLLAPGLMNFRHAMNLSVATQIAQRVISDCQQEDFDLLIDRPNLAHVTKLEGYTFRAPTIAEPGVRYFDEEGREIIPVDPEKPTGVELLRMVYQVNTRIQPVATVPALSDTATRYAQKPHLAQITVQVAVAPGNRKLEINPAEPDDVQEPQRNLFVPRGGMDIFTYNTYVGRGL